MFNSLRGRAAGLAAAFVCSLVLVLPQPATAQSSWTLVATGDFNGDGQADNLLRDGSGRVAVQLMNGSQVATTRVVGNMSGDWSVVNVGDFNGDGSSDIVWRNNVTGYAKTWWMTGAHINRVSTVPGNVPNAMIGTVDPRNPSTWTGIYMGGSVGSLGMTNTFTNAGQFSLCPPLPAVCVPDLTPSPVAFARKSIIAESFIFGYRHLLFTESLTIGAEGFIGGGGGDIRFTGIPGTFGFPGGIAPAAGATGDSVTISPTWNAGILGQLGTTFQVAGIPVFVAFDAGVGFQHINVAINCTGPMGACGANGITLQTLTTSSTLTGWLIGGEIDTKLRALPPFSGWNLGFLNNTTVGFQYLHGDYGTLGTTLGNPAQIQLTTSQKVTTNSAMAKNTFPLTDWGSFFNDGYSSGDRMRF